MDTGQLIAEHYRLAEHVGSGAMGIVWKAIDVRLQRPVAVKQIITQQGLSEQERVNVRQRAMREARNAARLQHPNAIVVFDIAEHAGDPCLVMEYMPAHSLSTLLAERGTLPIPEVARIGEQVAGALVAAHQASIVHRDVKPGNVLLDDNGVAKITDFGISRASGDTTLTQTGLIGGTPAYLAPELARGSDPSPSSDVFALGATLYHVIEGQPPYGDNNNQLALLYAAASGKIIPPSQAGPATALLMSMLRAEPEERPTMADARGQLATLAGGSSNGATPVAQPSPAPPPTATNRSRTAKPPWQRTETAQPANGGGSSSVAASAAPQEPPRTPTASFEPARQPPPTAAPPPPARGATRADQADPPRSSRRRKPILIGSCIAVVAVIAVIVVLNLPEGGGNHAQAGAREPTTAPTTAPATSTSRPTQSNASGPVEWTPAANLVIDFYQYAGSGKAWRMLSPSVQEIFGSKQEFTEHWEDLTVTGVGKARVYEHANNPDGSVDIRAHFETEDGKISPEVTVGRVDGELRIVSDPRLGHPGTDS